MADGRFSWQGFAYRFVAALVLVFATYNPEGYSFFHWVMANPGRITPELVLAAIALLIGWTVFIRASLRSLGLLGLVLAGGFFGTLVWALLDWGLVPAGSATAVSYLVEVALCAVLATGMSWSHVRRRLSGQADVDDV